MWMGREAARIVMGVEQRQLLMTVNDVERVVDVEGDTFGRRAIARQPQIDEDLAEADDGAQVRQVLGPRAGRLGAQIPAAVGQPSAGQLEGRIAAQPVEIVGVLIAAGDGEDAGAQDVGHGVPHAARISPIADHRGQPLGQSEAALGGGQQHDAAVRGHPSTVERGGNLLGSNGLETRTAATYRWSWRVWLARWGRQDWL